MVHKHRIEGYDNFVKFFENFDPQGKRVHIYFSGSKLPDSDLSWCDDCQRAWPVIKEEIERCDPESHFVYVEVGNREIWKDPKCPFRTDHATKLMVLPTLLRWKKPQRLEGEHCEKKELIQMLLEDDDA